MFLSWSQDVHISEVSLYYKRTISKFSSRVLQLTSVDAGLHEGAYRVHTALKVMWRDVGSVAHQEGQRLARLEQGLGVLVSQLLVQRDRELIDGRVGATKVSFHIILIHLKQINSHK